MPQQPIQNRIVIRGAGEMASGVIWQLKIAGYEVLALEIPEPCFVRRLVCYGEACYESRVTVEGLTCTLVISVSEAEKTISGGEIPLLIDPEAEQLQRLAPMAVIDARMLKQNIPANLEATPFLIGLGPGFYAGENCHAAVETNRGSNLGHVFYTGNPQPDTGTPAPIKGFANQRLLRSPTDGEFVSRCTITDVVKSGQVIGQVAGKDIVAEMDGMVRGLIHDGLTVTTGQKIGDIDPRREKERCYKISDKARAIGEGVLQAIKILKENNP
jgi:xanthine dehydrogenase accessory factor